MWHFDATFSTHKPTYRPTESLKHAIVFKLLFMKSSVSLQLCLIKGHMNQLNFIDFLLCMVETIILNVGVVLPFKTLTG
jgi:hypothetical protein